MNLLFSNKNESDYQNVLNLFSKSILGNSGGSDPIYLEYFELLKEWEKNNSTSLEHIVNFVKKYSIDTKSPYFISKLYSGSDSISFLADMLISYYNTNVYIYSVSPVFTLAEHLMVEKIGSLIVDDHNKTYGRGLFLPGGSYCNLIGLICARHHYDSGTKTEGMKNISGPISIITSTKSHYSIDKAAIMMGIGLNNVIKIDFEKITEDEFENIIKSNNVFCICSTFGTTSEGILESVERFRPLIDRYGLWHHIDACVGGVLVYSKKYKDKAQYLKNADSISMDFHKLANITLQCSALMINDNHSRVLSEVTNVKADYLFHNENDIDIGTVSFQCGRKADAFKLFVYDCVIDLSDRIDLFVDRVTEFKQIVKEDRRFVEYIPNPNTNISHVLFTPQIMLENDSSPDVINEKIGRVITALRNENIFLEYYYTFIRLVPINPLITTTEFKHILDRIDYHVHKI